MMDLHDSLPGRLPELARAKYVALKQAADDVAALARGATDERNALCPDLQRLQAELDGLRRVNPFNGGPAASDQRLHGLRTALARLRREAERLDDLIERRGSDHQRKRSLASAITHALADIPADHIRPYEGPAPKLRRGEVPVRAVERIRGELQALAAERTAVHGVPIPSGVAMQKARAQIEQLAARGRPDVHGIVSGRAEAVAWPLLDAVPQPPLTLRHGFVETPLLDGAAIMAWLARDEIVKRIEAEIDAASDNERALTDEERATRLADLDRRELELERAEEFFIEQAEVEGVQIVRRPNADPLAVLGIEIVDEPVEPALGEAA